MERLQINFTAETLDKKKERLFKARIERRNKTLLRVGILVAVIIVTLFVFAAFGMNPISIFK